jgi:hypothetical protein
MHWRTDFRHGLIIKYRDYFPKASQRFSLVPHHHLGTLAFPRFKLDCLRRADLLSAAAAAAVRVFSKRKPFLPKFAPEEQSRRASDNQQR